MKKIRYLLIALFLNMAIAEGYSQIDEGQLGAWYIYMWKVDIGESHWGFMGDIQYRNWDFGADLEQLLIRGGVNYTLKNAGVRFTAGYAWINSGPFGEEKTKIREHRIYQDIFLLPKKYGSRFYLAHRFRFEQRFIENLNFRSRYRYAIFLNVPINRKSIEKNTIYLALYNEIFLNGQRDIGHDITVEIFDRNRAYFAAGWAFTKNQRLQIGAMNQATNYWKKWQLQVGFISNF